MGFLSHHLALPGKKWFAAFPEEAKNRPCRQCQICLQDPPATSSFGNSYIPCTGRTAGLALHGKAFAHVLTIQQGQAPSHRIPGAYWAICCHTRRNTPLGGSRTDHSCVSPAAQGPALACVRAWATRQHFLPVPHRIHIGESWHPHRHMIPGFTLRQPKGAGRARGRQQSPDTHQWGGARTTGTDGQTTSICNGLRELQQREENNTAEASPQSPARVKWGSWFLAPAKRSLNACSGAALRVSRDRLHKRSPRLELAAAERGTVLALPPCQEEPSRGPGWPGGEGRRAGAGWDKWLCV